MSTYHIDWHFEVDADTLAALGFAPTPLGAAEYALQVQRDPESIATVFTIHDTHTQKASIVDVLDGHVRDA